MDFIKTSFLSFFSTAIRIIGGLVSVKFIAIYVGPSGLALIAQLQSLVNVVLLFSGGFLTTAITRYTAQNNGKKINRIWSAAFRLLLIVNVILFIVLFTLSDFLSVLLFSDNEYAYIIKILSVCQFFSGANVFLLAIANGKKTIRKYITIHIISSFLSLLLVVGLSYYFRVDGVMIAYVICQSVILIITMFFLKNEDWFFYKNFTSNFNCKDLVAIFNFSAITLTSIMCTNVSLVVVRKFIEYNFSLVDVGVWQATWNITQISMTLLTTSFAIYVLPSFSSLKIKSDFYKELKMVLLLVVPVGLLISLAIYLLRDVVIYLLYTEEFRAMEELIAFYMVGSFFKLICWVFGYVFVSQAKVRICVFVEIITALLFVFLSCFFMDLWGLVGSSYAYSLYSILNLLLLIYLFIFKFNPR